VLTSQPKEAAAILVRRGYKLVVKELYTITLRKNGINVDLYLHPSVGNIVFLRAEQLRGEVHQADFHGMKLPALKPPAEAALAIAHAVYKDGEVTLNDAVTYLRWREGTLEKCREWKCLDAARHFFTTLHDVLTGRTPAPRPIPTWPLNAVKRALTHPDLTPSLLQAPKGSSTPASTREAVPIRARRLRQNHRGQDTGGLPPAEGSKGADLLGAGNTRRRLPLGARHEMPRPKRHVEPLQRHRHTAHAVPALVALEFLLALPSQRTGAAAIFAQLGSR
jgi:hypothetical protein